MSNSDEIQSCFSMTAKGAADVRLFRGRVFFQRGQESSTVEEQQEV